MASRYIHIPFCLSKCHYCDFYSLGWGKAPIPEAEYLRALRQEWVQRREELAPAALAPPSTVFFGGGTPSLFSPETIGKILEDVGTEDPSPLAPLPEGEGMASVTEVTLELNPKTADRKKLEAFKEVGVNRISMGLQSLDDRILEKLGRAHSALEALESLEMALETGFDGVNVDVMYGLPYQELENLNKTLEGLATFPLTHLSAYELILEENTPFYDRYRYDRKPLPETETILQMHSALEDFARIKKMRLYEISNWASPGRECRHNLRYWDYESFLGMGAGAVSFLRWEELGPDLQCRWKNPRDEIPYGLRWTNLRNLGKYLERPGDLLEETLEWVSHETAQAEFMMMGLRKVRGIRFRDFQEKFQVSFPEKFFRGIGKFRNVGWVEAAADGFKLTNLGRQFSNEVIKEFL